MQDGTCINLVAHVMLIVIADCCANPCLRPGLHTCWLALMRGVNSTSNYCMCRTWALRKLPQLAARAAFRRIAYNVTRREVLQARGRQPIFCNAYLVRVCSIGYTIMVSGIRVSKFWITTNTCRPYLFGTMLCHKDQMGQADYFKNAIPSQT